VLFPAESPAGALGVCVIPPQFIEAFFLILLFLALLFVKRRKKFEGQILAIYLVFYSIIRFVIEFVRGDPRGNVFFLSLSQFISLFLLAFGAFLYLKLRMRKS